MERFSLESVMGGGDCRDNEATVAVFVGKNFELQWVFVEVNTSPVEGV
jgi:hypothetical protein